MNSNCDDTEVENSPSADERDELELDEDSGAPIEAVEVTEGTDPATTKLLIKLEAIFAFVGKALGGVMMIAGIVLAVLGYSGSVDFSIEAGDFSTHVVTGSIGIAVLIVGFAVFWLAKFQVKVVSSET